MRKMKLTGYPPLTSKYMEKVLKSGSPRPKCHSCKQPIRVGEVPAYYNQSGNRFAQATLQLVHEECLNSPPSQAA